MTKIHIANLRLRAIIGADDWEREHKQDIVINVTFDYAAEKAIQSDDLKDSVDYKIISKKIIRTVEASKYFLLEKLCHCILMIVLENKLVTQAIVRVDKPGALRFSDSVSVELTQDQTP